MSILFLTTADTDLITLENSLKDGSTEEYGVIARNILHLDEPVPFLRQRIKSEDSVFVRVIGGREYFADGFNVLEDAVRRNQIELAAVSGGHDIDRGLLNLSTYEPSVIEAIDECVRQGGPENIRNVLRMLDSRDGTIFDAVSPPKFAVCEEFKRTGSPRIALLYYRAYHLSGDNRFVEAAADQLSDCGFGVEPIFLSGLRDQETVREMMDEHLLGHDGEVQVQAIVSFMSFCASNFDTCPDLFTRLNVPWYQWISSSDPRKEWDNSSEGLSSSDLSMKVIMPEFDGRLHGPATSFKEQTKPEQNLLDIPLRRSVPYEDGIEYGIDQINGQRVLQALDDKDKKVAIILGNHPHNRARIGNGVGLDTPRSLMNLLRSMKRAGYRIGELPDDAEQMMSYLASEASYGGDPHERPRTPVDQVPSNQVREWIRELPDDLRESMLDSWQDSSRSPRMTSNGYAVPGVMLDNVYVGVQPPRGYEDDPDQVYHSPDLPPPPTYLAHYRWITRKFSADAVIHLGKHGTLEWLPGRSVAPGDDDWPYQIIEGTPLLYPFIINDPGEGSQAKRRASSVIIDHMIAPQRETELTDPMKEFEKFLYQEKDELKAPDQTLTEMASSLGIEIPFDDDVVRSSSPDKLLEWIEDIRTSSTRSGLHSLGKQPDDDRLIDWLESLSPERSSTPDRKNLKKFWRSPDQAPEPFRNKIIPALRNIDREIANVLKALEGGFIQPGPSGAPTRGRPDLLPTGRNFYSRDARGMPTREAWETGKELAESLLQCHRDREGSYPERIGVVLWGTSNMRTGGEDVAEVLALMGVRPVWTDSGRVEELEPIEDLGRPRIDPVVRISGFFRDAFPNLVELLNEGVRIVANLDDSTPNFVRDHTQMERGSPNRIFGCKPGNYGAGILPLIESGNWQDSEDLADVFMEWGKFAHEGNGEIKPARQELERQLGKVDAVTQNRDNTEHDLFDSDDYFQFHGGMVAAVESVSGSTPETYFTDTANPDQPEVRTLREEATRVFHSRINHPVWQEGMRDHGYKGAFEMDATLNYVYGYDATTGSIPDQFYDEMARDFLFDEENRTFLEDHNPWAIQEMGERFLEASERGLWDPPSEEFEETIRDVLKETEQTREETIQS